MTNIQPTIFAFDPVAARAFEGLVDYFERLDDLAEYRSCRTDAHLIARSRVFTAVSADRAWSVGAGVLARAFGDELAPDGKRSEATLATTRDKLRLDPGEAHRSMLVEIVMSHESEKNLPRPVPPASSQKDARALVDDLKEVLADIDLPETSVDLVLEHWLFAIVEQAGLMARGLGSHCSGVSRA